MEGNQMKMREALVNLTRFAEVDIRGLENLAKYAIDHSMYGGGVLQAVAGAIREGKNALAAPPPMRRGHGGGAGRAMYGAIRSMAAQGRR